MARGELEIGDGKPDISAAGGVVLRRGDDGKIRGAALHIGSPEEFWRNSKFLIIVREGPAGPATAGRTD